MCGITGFFNQANAGPNAKQAIAAMHNRGINGCGLASGEKVVYAKSPDKLKEIEGEKVLGHLLHNVVGEVRQPIRGKGWLSANCEIYNWKALAKKHKVKAKNDTELVLKLLEKDNAKLPDVLDELDGVWAFAHWSKDRVVLSRDLFGVKPLWYSLEKGLSFASEKKALKAAGCIKIEELDPRHVLLFDLEKNNAKFIERKFISINKSSGSFEENKEEFAALLEKAVEKRIPKQEFGLLFSAGIDSLLLALLFKKMDLKFKCFFGYVEGIGKPKDLKFVKKAAKDFGLRLETVSIKMDRIPKLLEKAVPLIESSNPVKVAVALPFLLALGKAKEKGIKVIFSGLGADELFCGYSKFRESNNLALDSLDLLLQMHENDLYRDDVVAMNNNLELRLPFLDPKIAEFALSLEDKFKLTEKQNKIILREAAKDLGSGKEYAERKKTAAQYGSNFDKAIGKLAKKEKAKGKADFLKRFATAKNLKLACLFSGGKDSCLALWIMQRQNYDVNCLVSIIPKNPDSFMYHQPKQELLELHSKTLGIPLLVRKTMGEKEKELLDLKEALKDAKKEFGIQGVVTGALYSDYQRQRVQKICLSLGLKMFSPLWHKKQLAELHELVDNNFVFIMSKIAGLGLDKEWLGKAIGKKEIVELQNLNEKIGLNVAGEGGEYESFVLDGPNFGKKIVLKKVEKRMENEFTGSLKIKSAELQPKN